MDAMHETTNSVQWMRPRTARLRCLLWCAAILLSCLLATLPERTTRATSVPVPRRDRRARAPHLLRRLPFFGVFSPSGRHCLVFAGVQNDYWIMDLVRVNWRSGSCQRLRRLPYTASFTFRPDGHHLLQEHAVPGQRGHYGRLDHVMWDLDTARPLFQLSATDEEPIEFSPGGRLLATTGPLFNDKPPFHLTLRNGQSGRFLRTIPVGDIPLEGVTISPDEQSMALLFDGGRVEIRDLKGRVLRTVEPASSEPYCHELHWIARDRWLAVNTLEGSAAVWELGTHDHVRRFAGPQHAVSGLTFSPDCQTAAGVCRDGPVRLWDLRTGKCIATIIAKHASAVTFIEGSHLIAIPERVGNSNTGTISIWDISPCQ